MFWSISPASVKEPSVGKFGLSLSMFTITSVFEGFMLML